MLVFLFAQVFLLKDRTFEDNETVLPTTLGQAGIVDSYLSRYNKFVKHVTDKHTDNKIRDYLKKDGSMGK
jgi:hypothetical protein